MKNRLLRVRALLMAPDGGAGGTGGSSGAPGADPAQGNPLGAAPGAGSGAPPAIDYAKIQQMLDGTLAAKEDTALKAYFKQQGLSQQEAEQAMAAFRAEKAKNQPDVSALQAQISQAEAAALQARVESAATMAAVGLGIDAKTIPYVLKLADLSGAAGQDGKINEEAVKNALNKVLEDVPALKPQAAGTTGFVQIGAAGNGSGQPAGSQDDALKKAFGL